jgi:glycosyltransferase involved in cell wall biosynthesis
VSPATPWEVREPGFVCIGRISPEKELDRVMDIVGGVRRTVPAVRLHIVGTPDDRRYYRHVAGRAAAEGVTLHESLTRDALAALVAGQRYGIHGMREEPFGLAPAELARAGCIVWVPNGGGQVEIVAEPKLIYESVDDAVAKIVGTLRDPGEQARLRAHLTGRQPLFSAERFMREIRAAVIEASGRSAASRAAAQEAAVAIARKPGSRASSSS